MDHVLIFSRTKHRADRISRNLGRKGFSTTVLHSNRSQSQRERSLGGFKSGHFKIMVATDIAARGIDVDSISHVINFDTPNQAEDYIHRIGRTGRALASGDAITFVSSEERSNLRRIESHTGKRLERKSYEGFARASEDGPVGDGAQGRSANTRVGEAEQNGSGSARGASGYLRRNARRYGSPSNAKQQRGRHDRRN